MTTEVQQHDLYRVLGVPRTASRKEIDKAYDRLVRRFDSPAVRRALKTQPGLKDKIALLQEAYDILSDSDRRETYDKQVFGLTRDPLASSHRSRTAAPAKGSPKQDSPKKQPEPDEPPSRRQNIYQDYYGFSEKPFDLTPDPKYLYLSPKHKEVLAHLVYGLQENNGFLKIVGEVGTGKTTICRSFLRELHTDFSIAYIFNPCVDELELLQIINAELGLPHQFSSRKKLIDVLNTFLLEERQRGHRVVVIIDEAQDLQPRVLEQLRLLSNLETETEKLIQIVLIGQPELDNLLQRDELRQLRQRITISWELLPLNLEETRGYIQHRLNVALGKGKVKFNKAALRLLYRYSSGIPRMINVLADRSLLIAYTLNTKQVNTKVVRLAVKDIGGLVPSSDWWDTISKKVLPGLAGVGLLAFLLNHFVLPDLKSDPNGGKDLQAMLKENPIALADPGKVVPRSSLKTDKKRVVSQPDSAGIVPEDFMPALEPESSPPQRRIPSTGPLVISQVDKLVTYLSSLSLMESKVEAVQWILKSWDLNNIELSVNDAFFLEKLEADYDLRQYELSGNLERLVNLNYPVLLELSLPNAQGTKYLALVSIQGNQGVFGSVDRIEMPMSVVDSLWTRKAIVFWKDFENLPEKFQRGYRGKEAIWLQKNLRLLGFFQGLEAPIYGEKTRNAVMKFQRENNIKDDGLFHTESKALLYSLMSIYPTPKLIAE